MTIPLLLLFAFALALLLTWVAVRWGRILGVVDLPDASDLKIHTAPVPLLGGPAVFVGAFLSLALFGSQIPVWVAAAALVALGVGLVDDVISLPPWARVVALAASGTMLAVGMSAGTMVVLGALGVVLLVLASANAVNLMDGQDGLAGGLGALACLGLAGVATLVDAPGLIDLSLAFAGALCGFLVWNRPPARIFLGNGGAYALGVLLAGVAATIIVSSGWRGLLASGMVMVTFVFETCLTVVRRSISHDSMTKGDRFHSYDLLAIRLGSRARSTLVFWSMGLGTAGLGLAIARLPLTVGVVIATVTAVAASLFGAVLWRGRPTKPLGSGIAVEGSA